MSIVTRRFIRCDYCKREVESGQDIGWLEQWRRHPGERLTRQTHRCPSCQNPPPPLFGETAA